MSSYKLYEPPAAKSTIHSTKVVGGCRAPIQTPEVETMFPSFSVRPWSARLIKYGCREMSAASGERNGRDARVNERA